MARLIWLSVCLLIGTAAAAEAGPVGAAISAAAAWFTGLGVVGQALVRLAVGAVLSRLAQAQQAQQVSRGIRSETTLTGGANSDRFVLGRYATSGTFVAPPMTWGPRNKRLVYYIDLGVAGQDVETIYLNGEPTTMTSSSADGGGGETYGMLRLDGFRNHISYKILDGTQTAADALMTAAFASDPDYPWQSDMIGKGRLGVIMNFFRDDDDPVLPGLPRMRFEVLGLPLYDPRADSSVGGTGAQRWADPTTWARSENPAVMIYNILRGISLPDGTVWGGNAEAEDLPFAEWVAAMNECDLSVSDWSGGTEAQFKAGYEVLVAEDEPAQVIETLLAACSGDIAEDGGTWHIQVGAPRLPIYNFTDGDVIVTEPADFEAFASRADTVNALSVTYVEPDASWETKATPPVVDSFKVTNRDAGVELRDDLSLPAVLNNRQAVRLGWAYLRDAGRERVHRLHLPPDAAHLSPLDCVAWTSDENGYDAKVFEIRRTAIDPRSLIGEFIVRERDPADYDFDSDDELPTVTPANTATTPDHYVLTGWSLSYQVWTSPDGIEINGFRIAGLPDDLGSVRYQIRETDEAGDLIDSGVAEVVDGETILRPRDVPGVTHLVRLRAPGPGLFAWSPWQSVTTEVHRVPNEALAMHVEVGAVTGLSLSTQTATVLNTLSEVVATWTAADGADRYEVGVAIDGGDEAVETVGLTRFSTLTVPSTSVAIRVRAVNATGERSAWTAVETITSAADAVAPPAPTGLTVTASIGTLWLEWVASAAADFSHFDIYASNSSSAPGAGTTPTIARHSGSSIALSGLSDTDTRWVWVRAVDTSGNASAWAGPVTGTPLSGPGTVVNDMLANGDLASEQSITNAIALVEQGLGERALFRVQSGDVVSLLDLIAANGDDSTSYSIAKLQAENIILDGTVQTRHLVVTNTENLVVDPEFADEDLWGQSGVSFSGGWGGKAKKLIRITGSATSYASAWSRPFPVQEGEHLYASAWGRIVAGSGSQFIDFAFFDVNDTWLTYDGRGYNASTGATLMEATCEAPSGAVSACLRLYKQNNGTTECFFGAPYARRMNDGKLTVDGTITASHIAGNTITADKINVSNLASDPSFIANLETQSFETDLANVRGTLTAANIDATNLFVDMANVTGSLDATRLNSGAGEVSGNFQVQQLTVASGGAWTPFLTVLSMANVAGLTATNNATFDENITVSGSASIGADLDLTGFLEITESASNQLILAQATSASYASTMLSMRTTRSNNTAFGFLSFFSNGFTDLEFRMRGDGNAFADGSWSSGGADYAEWFEWADGNPTDEDRRGLSVVLVGEKIREATTGETPIGVISAAPAVVGDTDMDAWKGKYLRDEYGAYQRNAAGERILNPDYDATLPYESRADRPEWDMVGLMGKLRLRTGQITDPRWVKMRNVTTDIEEWLAR